MIGATPVSADRARPSQLYSMRYSVQAAVWMEQALEGGDGVIQGAMSSELISPQHTKLISFTKYLLSVHQAQVYGAALR